MWRLIDLGTEDYQPLLKLGGGTRRFEGEDIPVQRYIKLICILNCFSLMLAWCWLLQYFLQYLYFLLLKCNELSMASKVRISRCVCLVVTVSGHHRLRQKLRA